MRCDVTLVFPGHAMANCKGTPRMILRRATATRRRNETYPELLRNGPQRRIILGSEVGGRWGAYIGHFSQGHMFRVLGAYLMYFSPCAVLLLRVISPRHQGWATLGNLELKWVFWLKTLFRKLWPAVR